MTGYDYDSNVTGTVRGKLWTKIKVLGFLLSAIGVLLLIVIAYLFMKIKVDAPEFIMSKAKLKKEEE